MTAIDFDLYDHAIQDDPYPVYARLRDEAPLFHQVEHDYWVISRHADVHAATRDDETLSNRMGVSLDPSAWNEHAHTVMSFLAMDPPEQVRLRRLVSKGFTPRRVRDLGPRVQQLTDDYLDQALASGSLDWVMDFAGRLPMDVISEMMGVPVADRDEVRRLADLVVHREDGLRDVPAAGMEAAMSLFDYYKTFVAEKRRNPADDLTSALLNAEDEGKRMTEDEINAFLFLMVVAGNETTTKLLGNAVFHLSQHREQQAEVLADPALVSPWIEETLRHDTSSQFVARLLVKDLTLHGRTAPAGSKLLLALGAANHDDRVFTTPETFDLHRDPDELGQILSFGGGRHFCLGANLARMESRIALESLVARVSDFDIDHDACARFYSANVRGFTHVPMKVTLR
ncbi:cytochrome P450 [Nocardioides piscis]|uniref:Cytochrome P450 n=1 Tax=Nocardioides piscis TaxID=2714938 RepID=A0A6G7YGN5_9ACTN|nr:cytochrome P450 [Nocardioides piscis]QIK75836.1 cytochrome P450 [Nocardioides piscis]